MLRSLRLFFARTAYRREITFVLVLKVIALVLLWKLFFSQPVEKSLTPGDVAVRFGTQR